MVVHQHVPQVVLGGGTGSSGGVRRRQARGESRHGLRQPVPPAAVVAAPGSSAGTSGIEAQSGLGVRGTAGGGAELPPVPVVLGQ